MFTGSYFYGYYDKKFSASHPLPTSFSFVCSHNKQHHSSVVPAQAGGGAA